MIELIALIDSLLVGNSASNFGSKSGESSRSTFVSNTISLNQLYSNISPLYVNGCLAVGCYLNI